MVALAAAVKKLTNLKSYGTFRLGITLFTILKFDLWSYILAFSHTLDAILEEMSENVHFCCTYSVFVVFAKVAKQID